MQISLLDTGPSIWYLGKPGDIKLSLNFCNPGPIDLDFNKLDSENQKKLLSDIKNNLIKSSETFEYLYKIWVKNEPKIEKSPEVDSYLKQKNKVRERKKEFKAKLNFEKQERLFNERVDSLSRRSINALKSFFKNNKDLRLAKCLKNKELKRKRPRISVMDFLNEYIKKEEYQIFKEIEKNNKKSSSYIYPVTPKETISYSVVESDISTIELNKEQLQQFAAGNPLVVDDS